MEMEDKRLRGNDHLGVLCARSIAFLAEQGISGYHQGAAASSC